MNTSVENNAREFRHQHRVDQLIAAVSDYAAKDDMALIANRYAAVRREIYAALCELKRLDKFTQNDHSDMTDKLSFFMGEIREEEIKVLEMHAHYASEAI